LPIVVIIMPHMQRVSRTYCIVFLGSYPICLRFIAPSLSVCGIFILTLAAEFALRTIFTSPANRAAEPIHQAGEFQQVRDTEQRPLPAQDDLRIGGNNVGPLRPNRANSPVVGLQQQGHPIPVVPLPYAE
jgi:hypothetical protein